ncbi:hypothetical protein KY290_037289 [Solanum tuberosum]|uniref:Uncharacterized protein n=1 Tax=Solanum tuberosum TaxID=4113 RepID=A0ABQ7TWD6_SOLTU|nr:hypothetical protein KY285_037756 [Solanum tuberosum]KAH0738584.1 hypothetical protein KY290_037289 [Solanum tuberosum]
MAQNEIEEMLDHLRRIKSGGNLDSVKINRIEKLEMVLKYHHVLLPDSLVKLTEKPNGLWKCFSGYWMEFQMNVKLTLIYEDDTDEDEIDIYEYYLFDKPPYVLFLIVLVELEMKKIFLSELKDSKFTQSRTFKDKKLPKEFFHHLHSLLMYLRNKKLENFPNNNSARNIDVAIKFLLVFLDADVANHVINGNWLNEVMDKVLAIVGDVLYVTQKLLPSSINKDDNIKISLCSIQILEKLKI